jgi:[acyl-carrier-protein] S-malonyltransferase
MGVALRGASARAREIFALADRVTGLSITRLTEEGPLERLTDTDVAQPAILATSLAALAVLREHVQLEPAAVAGHSVGELAAYVAAGALDEAAALHLVHARAQGMAAACQFVDGTMVAVLGLEPEPLRGVCQQASGGHGSVELANLNASGQLIISGARAAVDRAVELARAAGARRVMPLNVGGPFHSVYMKPAAERLAEALRDHEVHYAAIPVVANVSAEPIQRPDALADELVRQVYSPVRWSDSVGRLVQMSCDRFLEVGPGKVLSSLIKRSLPDAHVASFGAPGDLAEASAVLAAAKRLS